MGMSELIQQAGMALSGGQFDQAMELFDKAREAEPDNAVAHYGWAESAFMRLSMDMAEDVPAGKIMQVYKKAMQLDEENLEYVASFANFCLDCGRIPMAIKEYQRLERMADLNEIPVDDTLFDASRLIVDAIERVGQGRDNPMIKPWLRQSLVWAVGGLGFSSEEAVESLTSE
jgi:tetratricopeptide (TPR) repeat protein